jgi:hypothetical protein
LHEDGDDLDGRNAAVSIEVDHEHTKIIAIATIILHSIDVLFRQAIKRDNVIMLGTTLLHTHSKVTPDIYRLYNRRVL